MDIRTPGVPFSADPGYIGTPIGWADTTGALVAANRIDVWEIPPSLTPRTISTAWFNATSHTGTPNLCIALYDIVNNARLATTGSFVFDGTDGLHSQALSASVAIPAGIRLAATLIADNTGVTFAACSGNLATWAKPTAGLYYGGVNTAGAGANFPAPTSIPALIAATSPGRIYGVMFT